MIAPYAKEYDPSRILRCSLQQFIYTIAKAHINIIDHNHFLSEQYVLLCFCIQNPKPMVERIQKDEGDPVIRSFIGLLHALRVRVSKLVLLLALWLVNYYYHRKRQDKFV